MKEIKNGESIIFLQKNGNKLVVLAQDDCLNIKAESPGTDVETERVNVFRVKIKAVKEKNLT